MARNSGRASHDKLLALQALEQDWDSYGAPPIAPAAIERASQLLNPEVVPTPIGGVQLEWHTARIDLEMEVSPTGRVRVWLSYEEQHDILPKPTLQ